MAVAAAALAFLAAIPLSAQEPPDTTAPPDTVPRDTTQQVPDTAAVQVDPDTVFHNLPRMEEGVGPSFEAGAWVWDREALLSTRAPTLGALLAQVPGVIPLRGGDHGTPQMVTAFGLAGGRLRVFLDGFELLPLDGAVTDLSRIALAGLAAVRLERGMGEIRVDLESLRVRDPRPMSLVEAGTGDLNTNQFRGTFVHPRLLGGSFGGALERLDTRGPRGAETGARSGGWLRYTLHRGDDAGLRFEMRNTSAETDVSLFPGEVSRSDWTVRARARLADGVVAEAFTGRSALEGGTDDGLTPIDENRRQHGVRASFEGGPVWLRGAFRLLGGVDLPSSSLDLQVGASVDGWGGGALRYSRDSWAGEAAALTAARAWTEPFYGVSAFASWSDGSRGSRIFPPREPVSDSDDGDTGDGTDDPEPPEETPAAHRVLDRSTLRAGLAVRLGPLALSGARLRFEADSLAPLGTQLDRGGPVAPGGEFTGFEAELDLALPLSGFGLYGSVQQWDREARYLPKQVYRGGLDFHDIFLESGNLELWGSVGVEGRDPMLVPQPPGDEAEAVAELVRVPFYQSWHAFIQVRILSLRLFVDWENVTVRRNNQDFPDRVLPFTRATYGVRWTLWN